ncbi:MAG: NUDIX domain-containing protein [Oscillospiraceae bacterium]|jgi:tRNA nucleotidyltransferase (CCA-adding enzyme)|nr:NUDIX domain-containing protein [Oscillospiraceae bacterium]
MLGRYVRVKVTQPISSVDKVRGFEYKLNFGDVSYISMKRREKYKAYILGIDHPVRVFDGRVIAVISKGRQVFLIVAPKSKKYIENEIKGKLSFAGFNDRWDLVCLYECSCGAVVFRAAKDEIKYLIIKNNRSAHWSFPKGHVEQGESFEDTAKREVLEETGVHIDIVSGFMTKSEYMIQGRVEKTVIIFLGVTNDTNTTIQEEEIEDYKWLRFDGAMNQLKFENDKKILKKANEFICDKNIMSMEAKP